MNEIKPSIIDIRIAYDIVKASRRVHSTGKVYTDSDFARDYLEGNFTIVSKVLNGAAVSQKVMTAILRFIADTRPQLEYAMKIVDDITCHKSH